MFNQYQPPWRHYPILNSSFNRVHHMTSDSGTSTVGFEDRMITNMLREITIGAARRVPNISHIQIQIDRLFRFIPTRSWSPQSCNLVSSISISFYPPHPWTCTTTLKELVTAHMPLTPQHGRTDLKHQRKPLSNS